MNLGITFDEQILKEVQIQHFIEKLTLKGCQSMELSPDTSVLPLHAYTEIGKTLAANDYTLDYHVPYFSKQHNPNCEFYDISYFRSNKSQVISKYEELLSIIDTLRQYSVITPNLILHPGSFNTLSMGETESEEATKFFFDWFLNFLCKRNLDINVAVETLDSKDQYAFTSRNQLLELVQLFDLSHFGVCWDLTHDSENYSIFEPPTKAFFEKVHHVHIHGYDKAINKKHRPLHNGTYHCKEALTYLIEHNYSKRVVDELLIHHADHYMTDVMNDLNFLTTIIKTTTHPSR